MSGYIPISEIPYIFVGFPFFFFYCFAKVTSGHAEYSVENRLTVTSQSPSHLCPRPASLSSPETAPSLFSSVHFQKDEHEALF